LWQVYSDPDPGRKDLILADFQAKLLAGGAQHPDPVEERMNRIFRWIVLWAVLETLVAAVLAWFFDAEVAAIGLVALILVALLAAWRSRGRRKAEITSLSEQP
jgi:Flp pilus assembly protein TadB